MNTLNVYVRTGHVMILKQIVIPDLDEHIASLVAELVPPGREEQEGLVQVEVEVAVEVTVDKIHDPELVGLMQILKLVTDPLHVEAVGGDEVRPPLDQVLRLLPRDVAHSGEDVRQVGGRPLQAVSVVDLPLARLHVHVEVLKLEY